MASLFPISTTNLRLPGVPTPVTPAIQPNAPTFDDIRTLYGQPLNFNAMRPIAGQTNFDKGLAELSPSTGIRPEIQNALDLIKQRGDELKAKNISDAVALASRRGIGGSSTELFGTTEAAKAADAATQTETANLLLENARREQALQDARAKALFERSGQESSLGAQLGINEAQLTADQRTKLASLTSDEIASLRNMDFANRQLFLEGYLGQKGLDIQRENIGISKDIAADQAKYGLIGQLGSSLLPGLLFGGGGGGGLFGGGGGGAAGGGLLSKFGGLFGGGAAGGGTLTGAATGQVVPGIGAVGTGVPAAGVGAGSLLGGAGLGYLGGSLGKSVFGGGNDLGAIGGAGLGFLLGGPLGAAVGGFAGTGLQRLGENVYGKSKKILGNTGASLLKPFTNPIGTVSDLGHKVGSGIKKVFPF